MLVNVYAPHSGLKAYDVEVSDELFTDLGQVTTVN